MKIERLTTSEGQHLQITLDENEARGLQAVFEATRAAVWHNESLWDGVDPETRSAAAFNFGMLNGELSNFLGLPLTLPKGVSPDVYLQAFTGDAGKS